MTMRGIAFLGAVLAAFGAAAAEPQVPEGFKLLNVGGGCYLQSSDGRALYTALLGEEDATLRSADHVVIIPDGALWQVPFQALQTPRGAFRYVQIGITIITQHHAH